MPSQKYLLIAALKQRAALMELMSENPFHCKAILKAARTLEGLEGEPADWLAAGILPSIQGVGKGTIDAVRQWVETGRIKELDELLQKIPAGLPELLTIPGLGAKKIFQLWEQRGIDSLAALEAAARSGALNDLKGIGEKGAQKIIDGIAQRQKYGMRFRLDVAFPMAEEIFARMRQAPQVKRMELAGSLRRRRETIKDLDFVAVAEDPAPVMAAFKTMPRVETVVADGLAKTSVLLAGGIPADLRVVKEDEFGAALVYFTGSTDHNVQLRGRAQKMGFKLNEYGLFPKSSEAPLKLKDEAGVYRKLGLDYIEPELREGRGEIEAAESGLLPDLIKDEDMQGVLHCHSTWSDGRNTIEEMARACQAMGYKYFAICDHSQTAAYAGGLKPDDLRRQWDEIDEVNARLKGFHIFKGVESDILGDGALDYPDSILSKLDIVVASVHSRMKMEEAEMTARLCAAIENPRTTILGHPTGRRLLERESYALDLEKVLGLAAEKGVVVEINAHPHRLDLDWTWVRRAKQLGCKIAVDPDAHSIKEIGYIRHGIGIARKGWLEKADVINTMSAADFAKWLKRRR